VIQFGGTDPIIARNQLCEQVRAIPTGTTIFPGRAFQQSIDVGLGKEDIENAIKQYPTFKGFFESPVLVACIGYRPTFNSTSVYTTGYIMSILRVEPDGLNAGFRPGDAVEAQHLLLRLYPISPIEAH
jgi:hypothetical protein